MEESLRLLAEKLGVATNFSDAGLVQKDYCVDEKIICKIIWSKSEGYSYGPSER